jgi:Holliday junction resolvase-like predicted endonuclease
MNLIPSGIIPPLSLDEIRLESVNHSRGEYLCLSALEKVAEEMGWYILRSYNLENHVQHAQGEIDILIVTPKCMVCIEVKSSRIIQSNEGYKIFNRLKNNWEPTQDPFLQCKNNHYSLIDLLRNFEILKFNFPVVWCVWFPEMNQFDVGAEYGIWRIGLSHHLTQPREFIENVIFNTELKLKVKFHEKTTQHQLLVVNSLRKIGHFEDLDEKEILTMMERKIKNNVALLTQGQKLVFEGLKQNNKIIVFGGAGTGKSYLALIECLHSVQNGMTVMILVQSKYLKRYFLERFVEYGLGNTDLTVVAIDDDGWDGVEFCLNRKKYNSLVVDEYQDFLGSDYFFSVLSEVSFERITLFGDHINQMIAESQFVIHEKLADLLNGFVKFTLSKNCRNTQNTITSVKRITGLEKVGTYMENTISGERVEHICINNVDKVREYALKLTNQGISPNDIIIIDIDESDNICSNEILNFEGFELFGGSGMSIKIARVRDVKGLEFDYVLIVGLGRSLNAESKRLIYIAMTRAIIKCVIFYDLDKDFSILPYIAKL